MEPVSIAGLPAPRSIVCVGPPLLASAPRSGFCPVMFAAPVIAVPAAGVRISELSAAMRGANPAPATSGPELLATIVLCSTTSFSVSM